jgi:hypothetical protein
MSAFDPKRTLRAFDANRIKHRSLKIQPHDTNGRSEAAIIVGVIAGGGATTTAMVRMWRTTTVGAVRG